MQNWLDKSDPYFDVCKASTEADKKRLDYLIAGAVSFVEVLCNRRFKQQEHDLTFYPTREGTILLKHCPISSVSRVCVDQVQALSVINTAAQVATFSVSDTALTLVSYTAGVKASTALTLASYATLGSLVAAIKAVSGWDAWVSSEYTHFPTVDLVRQQSGSATLSGNYLVIWYDYLTPFDFDSNVGILSGGFYGRTRVVYTGGFAVVPEDLKEATSGLAVAKFMSPEGQVKSESLGGYSYTLRDLNELPASFQKVISFYKDRT